MDTAPPFAAAAAPPPSGEEQRRALQDRLIVAMLELAATRAWDRDTLTAAADRIGVEPALVTVAFPNGLADTLDHVADWADRQMLAAVEGVDLGALKVRERIRRLVWARFAALEPYAAGIEATSRAAASDPRLALHAPKLVWRTADRVWHGIGDTSTDYNFYTKRATLSTVLVSTTLVWLRDDQPGRPKAAAHLDRRIEGIIQFGKATGQLKERVDRFETQLTEAAQQLGARLRRRRGASAPETPPAGGFDASI